MESTAIQQMVDNIINGQSAEAIETFNSIIGDKVTTALEAKKTEVAATIGAPKEDETV
jgi:N-acetyl-gamma-glutamylphosphate reductase